MLGCLLACSCCFCVVAISLCCYCRCRFMLICFMLLVLSHFIFLGHTLSFTPHIFVCRFILFLFSCCVLWHFFLNSVVLLLLFPILLVLLSFFYTTLSPNTCQIEWRIRKRGFCFCRLYYFCDIFMICVFYFGLIYATWVKLFLCKLLHIHNSKK